MKYCKKCGMLLEDTTTNCIRCGLDVTISDNFSLFPIEVMESLDAQKTEQKKKVKIVVMIVLIFTLLVALIAVGAIFLNKTGYSVVEGGQSTDKVEEVQEVVEEVVEEELPADNTEAENEVVEEEIEEEPVQEEETIASGKEVKDENGSYYNFSSMTDDAENVILNVLYPEDFTDVDFTIDYGKYSTRFPISMRFVAGNADNSIRFLYMSPQQLWYKNSETGKTRDNELDISYYMSFFKYEDAKAYIVSMLEESYPKAKIELVNEEEFSEKAVSELEALSKARSKALFGDIGDYAHIGSDTTYANMEADYSASVFEYEITTTDKEMVFDKFYVPVIANNLYYASDKAGDRGTVTEWYCLAFIALEAGNEDLYDDYSDDFNVFISTCVPTDKFMYINQMYSKDVKDAISSLRTPDALTVALLDDYTDSLKKGLKLNDFNTEVMTALKSVSSKAFNVEDITVYTSDSINTVYVDKDGGKAFISPDKDEYPGDDYVELKEVEINGAEASDGDNKTSDDEENKSNSKSNKKSTGTTGVN